MNNLLNIFSNILLYEKLYCLICKKLLITTIEPDLELESTTSRSATVHTSHYISDFLTISRQALVGLDINCRKKQNLYLFSKGSFYYREGDKK